MTLNDEWLNDRVTHLRGLKSRSDQQEMLVLLAEKPSRSAAEEKKLALLVRAEKAAISAAKARLAANKLIQAEKKAVSDAARKARNHEMFESAGLLILAGLVDTKTGKPLRDRAELLGALLSLAKVTPSDPRWTEWREVGKAKLANDGQN